MAKTPKAKKSASHDLNGGDNFTRWLVAGMVGLVLIVAVAFSLFNNRTDTAATLPSTVKQSDGYGISFNSGIKPIVDIWEDFQCPVCKNFESVIGDYLNQLIVEKKVNVIFHTLSFIGFHSFFKLSELPQISHYHTYY
jgi:protein-disulfide isomerase